MTRDTKLTILCILAGLGIFALFGPYAWIILLLSLIVLFARKSGRAE